MFGKPDAFNYNETDEKLRYEIFKEREKVCKSCIKCRLSETRKNVVFGEGALDSKIMLIGEGPGNTEDKTARPFVGQAGKLLDKFLNAENISREKDIYITNIVKCRPPQNRKPKTDEAEACREYLEAQVKFIQPKIFLLAGATAVKNILGLKEEVTKVRGKWFDGPFNSKIMPIFHPSYLLRNESKEVNSPKWHMEQDFKEIKRALDNLST